MTAKFDKNLFEITFDYDDTFAMIRDLYMALNSKDWEIISQFIRKLVMKLRLKEKNGWLSLGRVACVDAYQAVVECLP